MKLDLKKFDILIFDFDGTLVQPIPLNWNLLKKQIDYLCQAEGLNTHITNDFSSKITLVFQYSTPLKKKIINLIKNKEQSTRYQIKENPTPILILQTALQQNKTIFILSNNCSPIIKHLLKTINLTLPSKNILSLDKNPSPKPSLSFFQKIHHLVRSRRRVLYIGNSNMDHRIAELLKFTYIDVHELG